MRMPVREAIILRGISGAGKSTYARRYFPDAAVVSADEYFVQDGSYAFDAQKLQEAHEYCFRRFLDAIVRGERAIAIDNTNVELYEISPYLLAARAFGYRPTIITLVCDAATAEARGIHGVPAEKIRRKADRVARIRIPSSWPHETVRTDIVDYHLNPPAATLG